MAVRLGTVGVWTAERMWDFEDGVHREAIAELDELGYGACWLGNASGALHAAAKVLEHTKKLVTATGIVNVWTHDAEPLAAAYQRVDTSYPGRLLIGLGTSHAPIVEASGQRYTRPYSKLRSYLDEIDQAPAPLPPHVRVLGALGPRSIELARDRTAGAHPYLTTPEHTALAREILGADALLAPELMVVLETDPSRAREIARRGVDIYLRLPNYLKNLRRLGFADSAFDAGGSDRLIDAVVGWGGVDDIARRVREHHDAGADHVAIQVLTGSNELPLPQWRELAPALRD